MHRLISLFATGAVVTPLVVAAQTENPPREAPSTDPVRGLPAGTRTATDSTNPAGTLPGKERAVRGNATATPGTGIGTGATSKRRWVRTNHGSSTSDAPQASTPVVVPAE